MLVRQKQHLELDLIIIKVHTGPIDKNKMYQSSVLMNMGNTAIMGLMIGSLHQLNNVKNMNS